MIVRLLLFYFLILSPTFAFEFSVLHTNDLHSSFEGESFKSIGNYARLATAIKRARNKLGIVPSILVDAGDFYSGSITHTLAVQADIPYFPEYEFFSSLSYDAITLGNHEFDGGEKGFKIMLSKILKMGARTPIVSTNLSPAKHPILKSKISTLVNQDGQEVKIGILGALGPDGCAVSRGNRVQSKFHGYDDGNATSNWDKLFDTLLVAAQDLRTKGADVILLLLHGGDDEDARIAKEIPLIDIVIAGHTHKSYFKKVNNTYIAQAGSNGKFLGEIKFSFDKLTRKLNLISQKRSEINESLSLDEEVNEKILFYERTVENYLKKKARVSINFQEVIFTSKQSYNRKFEMHNSLGQEVTTTIAKRIRSEKHDFSIYFTSLGLIRADIVKGSSYGIKDVFKLLPIGFDEKLMPGAKAMSFYITFKELKRLVQFLEIYSRLKPKFTPAFSRELSFEVNKYGIPLINRISDLRVNGIKLKDSDLVHVGTNSFVFKYISFIKKKSFGFVEIIPKDSKGATLKLPYTYYPEYLEFALAKKL